MEEIRFSHRPVLLEECLEALSIRPDGVYVDGTAGGAGHSSAIASRLGESGRLLALDQDETAVRVATERLSVFGERARVVRSNFREVESVCRTLGIPSIDGMLMDLGVSSYQLDNPERGFSYMADAPLDMRMDKSQGMTAAEYLAKTHFYTSEYYLGTKEFRDLTIHFMNHKMRDIFETYKEIFMWIIEFISLEDNAIMKQNIIMLVLGKEFLLHLFKILKL